MQEERSPDQACLSFRESFEPGVSAVRDDAHPERHVHADHCLACARWRKQINSLVEEVAATTQYDVPESATQRVFAAVSRERKFNRFADLIWAGGSVVAFAVVLVIAPVDSIDGLCSWVIGALFVSGFGVLAQAENKQRAFARE